MGKNLLIIHGGGPTAVINASLYGALKEAAKHPEINKIYGAKNGTGGVLKEELIDLTDVEEEELTLLLQTPGSAIGTSRDEIWQEEYDRMMQVVQKYEIGYILFNGGNGTMDTCGKMYKNCKEKGENVYVKFN